MGNPFYQTKQTSWLVMGIACVQVEKQTKQVIVVTWLSDAQKDPFPACSKLQQKPQIEYGKLSSCSNLGSSADMYPEGSQRIRWGVAQST